MNKFWEGKKILVTGGAGFLGSYVVKELIKRGVSKISIPRSKKLDLERNQFVQKL